MTYNNPDKKKGAAKRPIAIKYAPTKLLNAFGRLHTAEFIPEAAPRSSSTTMPIIIDCSNGVDMFSKKLLKA